MNYILEIRTIQEHELCPRTPFIPEEYEYEMHLDALMVNLSQIDAISQVRRRSSIFQIQTTYSIIPTELRVLIKPALTGDMMNCLRFVSLLEEKDSSRKIDA